MPIFIFFFLFEYMWYKFIDYLLINLKLLNNYLRKQNQKKNKLIVLKLFNNC